MTRAYDIAPRAPRLGGGWSLRLLEDGEEVGGGYFPPLPSSSEAYLDLMDMAYDFVEAGEDLPGAQQEK